MPHYLLPSLLAALVLYYLFGFHHPFDFRPTPKVRMWQQTRVTLRPQARGCHLVTDELVRAITTDLARFRVGIAHLFIQHTSASLSINESYDPDVRKDAEMLLNRMAPEDAPYLHRDEGPDDMPAHFKAMLVGTSLSLPITQGKLALGTWQGIWLCEHRNHAGSRTVVVTLQGE